MLRDWLRLFSKELLVKKTICTTKTNVYTFILFKKKKTIAEVQPCVWSDRKVPFCYVIRLQIRVLTFAVLSYYTIF